MTSKERKILTRLIQKVRDAQVLADRLEILLPNGAEAGGLLGGIADDLEAEQLLLGADRG